MNFYELSQILIRRRPHFSSGHGKFASCGISRENRTHAHPTRFRSQHTKSIKYKRKPCSFRANVENANGHTLTRFESRNFHCRQLRLMVKCKRSENLFCSRNLSMNIHKQFERLIEYFHRTDSPDLWIHPDMKT